MADLTISSTVVVSHVPFLIKKYSVTATNANGTIPHGEGRTPDFAIAYVTAENPTASEVAVTALDATNVTIDCEAASKAVDVVVFWMAQSDGGIALPG